MPESDKMKYFCYRYRACMGYDLDIIWAFVSRAGGEISEREDHTLVWVPQSQAMIFSLAWPDLEPLGDLQI
jgi:hypothetical protein